MELDIQYCLVICGKMKFMIGLDISEKVLVIMKKGFKNSIDHNFARITIDSYSSLPIEKILTFHNVIILIKSTVNNNENYYYNIFLEIRFAKR